MANQRCPGCGAPYNGKKCRRCLYQPMAVKAPASSPPVRRKKLTTNRKSSSALGSLLGFLILLALIAMLLPVLRSWGTDMQAIAEANASSQFPASSSAVP